MKSTQKVVISKTNYKGPFPTPLHTCAEPNSIRYDFSATLERQLIQTAYFCWTLLSETRGKYLLLTEFEGRTVNYGPCFSLPIYGPSAKRAGRKSKGKNKGS